MKAHGKSNPNDQYAWLAYTAKKGAPSFTEFVKKEGLKPGPRGITAYQSKHTTSARATGSSLPKTGSSKPRGSLSTGVKKVSIFLILEQLVRNIIRVSDRRTFPIDFTFLCCIYFFLC